MLNESQIRNSLICTTSIKSVTSHAWSDTSHHSKLRRRNHCFVSTRIRNFYFHKIFNRRLQNLWFHNSMKRGRFIFINFENSTTINFWQILHWIFFNIKVVTCRKNIILKWIQTIEFRDPSSIYWNEFASVWTDEIVTHSNSISFNFTSQNQWPFRNCVRLRVTRLSFHVPDYVLSNDNGYTWSWKVVVMITFTTNHITREILY